MPDPRPDPPDLRRMLAAVGVERFFADYWQRRTLALALEVENFARILDEVGPLDIARFTGLAREGAQAWVANDYIAHSVIPVDAPNAEKLFGIGATLYFINVPIDRLTHSLADFLGAPRQKVIASLFLTPSTGGASAHFDKNENFTIQLTGAKRWIVGEFPTVASPPDGYMLGQTIPPSLKNLLGEAAEQPNQTVDMRPGTLLYVPRGTVHRTEAGEVSWSLNLSYSPSMWLDLVKVGLQRQLAASARWRGTVTGVGKACDPAAREANRLPELIAELRETLADPDELDKLCRAFLDYPDG
ncbi:MAG TPA: cupin domain-containing protein [Rhizomicrobium sp.]|nr:cupin domain-containing protein [Rhizomicrobium sp.]